MHRATWRTMESKSASLRSACMGTVCSGPGGLLHGNLGCECTVYDECERSNLYFLGLFGVMDWS